MVFKDEIFQRQNGLFQEKIGKKSLSNYYPDWKNDRVWRNFEVNFKILVNCGIYRDILMKKQLIFNKYHFFTK